MAWPTATSQPRPPRHRGGRGWPCPPCGPDVPRPDSLSLTLPVPPVTDALSSPLDSRRQTGAGFLLDGPGAAMEVLVPEPLRQDAADAWRRHARGLCRALGWTDAALVVRPFPRGLSLGLGAPVDRLYTATEVNEAAWRRARAKLDGRDLPDLGEAVDALRAASEREADPALAALLARGGPPRRGRRLGRRRGHGRAGEPRPDVPARAPSPRPRPSTGARSGRSRRRW